MDDKHIYEFHSNLMHTMKKKKKESISTLNSIMIKLPTEKNDQIYFKILHISNRRF